MEILFPKNGSKQCLFINNSNHLVLWHPFYGFCLLYDKANDEGYISEHLSGTTLEDDLMKTFKKCCNKSGVIPKKFITDNFMCWLKIEYTL